MKGDFKTRGKVHSTEKNAAPPRHGRSYLTVTSDYGSDSGGDKDQCKTGKKMNKGMAGKAGKTIQSPDKQNPKAQRNRKIEAWCQGKKESYS